MQAHVMGLKGWQHKSQPVVWTKELLLESQDWAAFRYIMLSGLQDVITNEAILCVG